MKAKVKCGILACAICVVLGAALCLVTISRLGDKRTARKEGPGQAVESTKARLTREKLRQAVRNAKGGDRNELDASIESVARGRYVEVTEELLPDFVSFLQDEDPQVQLLGAQSLYALKSPESTETLSTYLRGKDFAKLKEMADTGGLDARHAARWEGQASVIAILALGEIGDKSAIPLLESLKEVKELHDGAPVERALAKLGAIESLSNVPPGADNKRIWRACDAISEIKDPQKVLELMATVYNKNCALPIRDTALRALGKINTGSVPEFLLGVINDSQVPVSMRGTAAITAAQTGNNMFEETLLEIADSNSEIRIEGLCGLTLLKPDKYLKNIFRMIRDINEPDEFRRLLAGRLYIPWQKKQQLLGGRKDELYACLNTDKADGSPHDEIRVRMWRLINEVFGEEPSIVLSSKSSRGISTLKSIIQRNLRQQWRQEPWNEPSIEELMKMTNEKFKSIVTFLPENSGAEK